MKKKIGIIVILAVIICGAFWAKNYYAPGTYIKVDTSKTLEVGVAVVEESSVPQKALEKINLLGTKSK